MNWKLFAFEVIILKSRDVNRYIYIYNFKHIIYLLNIEIEDHEQNINKCVKVL
jgi:hypothetical protein